MFGLSYATSQYQIDWVLFCRYPRKQAAQLSLPSDLVSWTQAGFIRDRSCGNNLWILRRVFERAVEFNTPVYCLLVDYKGAFDALNHTTLSQVAIPITEYGSARNVFVF